MKNTFAAITLALVFVLASGAIAIAQNSVDRHQKMDKMDKKESVTSPRGVNPKVTTSIKEIVEHYLHLKNALVSDDTKDAAIAGKEMVAAMEQLDKSSLHPEQKKVYEDIEDDAKEHAEHIGENAGKIAHQREHFGMLSKDLYDLVKAFGSEQILFEDFCPMVNDKKGAIWLSETKQIKNPYYGKQMPTCGSVKEEIK